MLSAYVEDRYASRLIADGGNALEYLLEERVGKVTEFTDAVRRVAADGIVMDPEVISQLLSRRRVDDPIRTLTPREREVLGLMAVGLGNGSIAAKLFVTDTAVSKRTAGTGGCSLFWHTSEPDRVSPAATGQRPAIRLQHSA